MNRFNRDYAVVGPNGRIFLESHSAERCENLRKELAEEGIGATVVKSDLPRRVA
jgi:hypothetical protein